MIRIIITVIVFLVAHSLPAQYSERDWSDRDTWMDVDFIFDQAGITEGNHVADIGCHEGYLEHVYNSLKPGGRIVIVEKLKSWIKGKSRDAQTDAHSLSTKYVKRELTRAGFTVTYENNDLGDWERDTDKVIWMLTARKGYKPEAKKKRKI